LGLGGIVFGVPIPEEHEAVGTAVEEAVTRAVAECREKNVEGRDVTPFLLRRVRELSDGKSLEANLALVKNNAEKGADIAVAVARLAKK
jgi:pseudouridine-5'-phosphate glycosidase